MKFYDMSYELIEFLKIYKIVTFKSPLTYEFMEL